MVFILVSEKERGELPCYLSSNLDIVELKGIMVHLVFDYLVFSQFSVLFPSRCRCLETESRYRYCWGISV
jgi:hypothetical protein